MILVLHVLLQHFYVCSVCYTNYFWYLWSSIVDFNSNSHVGDENCICQSTLQPNHLSIGGYNITITSILHGFHITSLGMCAVTNFVRWGRQSLFGGSPNVLLSKTTIVRVL